MNWMERLGEGEPEWQDWKPCHFKKEIKKLGVHPEEDGDLLYGILEDRTDTSEKAGLGPVERTGISVGQHRKSLSLGVFPVSLW